MATFVERMIGAAKLDVRTYEEVESDVTATAQALGVVAIAAVASAIGSAGEGSRGMLGGVVAAIIGWAIAAAVVYLIGGKLLPDPETKADVGELLRTLGFAQSVGVAYILGIIPILGWLAKLITWVWMLCAMVVAVRQALDYKSTGKAVLVCLLAIVAYAIVAAIIFGILGLGSFALGTSG